MNYSQPAIIGIVAGVGPYAGLDLLRKIADQTIATRDQDHLTVLSVSWPSAIPDRTAYLLGQSADNPAEPIADQVSLLAQMGATVVGIPCNTAHAAPIFEPIVERVAELERPPRLLHMIHEVGGHLRRHYPDLGCVGVLSTTGTAAVGLYPAILEPLGYKVVAPDATTQGAVQAAIYDPDYGIKASGRVTTATRAGLEDGMASLQRQGAEAIVLGCTELPLVFEESELAGRPLIDPTLILARALIREVAPGQVNP